MSKGAMTRGDRKKIAARKVALDVRSEYVAKTGLLEGQPKLIKHGKRKEVVYKLRPTKQGDKR